MPKDTPNKTRIAYKKDGTVTGLIKSIGNETIVNNRGHRMIIIHKDFKKKRDSDEWEVEDKKYELIIWSEELYEKLQDCIGKTIDAKVKIVSREYNSKFYYDLNITGFDVVAEDESEYPSDDQYKNSVEQAVAEEKEPEEFDDDLPF